MSNGIHKLDRPLDGDLTQGRVTPSEFAQLNFGAPAAERDTPLASYFVESEAYQAVQAGRKYIVLGNRGSGKSAIFRVLAEREKGMGTIVIQLSPEDYSYEMLSSTMQAENSGAWAK